MGKNNENNCDKVIEELIQSFDDLPILARLEFVSNLICKKLGDSDDPSRDKALAVADGVLNEVIRVLKTVPNIADLRGPL
jgi:hypothetical protein